MTHACTSHAPGNPTCYQHCHCRCEDCLHGQYLYRKHHRAKHVNGRPPVVPAAPVARHIERCLAAGMSMTDIGERADYGRSELRDILNGKQPGISRACAARVLAVIPAGPRHGRIDGTGTRRRLQALARIGWTWLDLAPLLGISRSAVGQIAIDNRRVHVKTATYVSELYDRVWSQPRTGIGADRAIRRAVAKGWPPPLAWDDDSIDNPKAKPCGDRRSKLDAATEVAQLLGTDSANGIAKRLGFVDVDSLATTIGRKDKHLADRLRAEKEVA